MMAVPRISAGCASRIASSVLLAMASMKPAPSVLVEIRNVRISSWKRHELVDIGMGRARVNQRAAERLEEFPVLMCPVLCSATWLAPPVTTF
jgi:hypothetical protein